MKSIQKMPHITNMNTLPTLSYGVLQSQFTWLYYKGNGIYKRHLNYTTCREEFIRTYINMTEIKSKQVSYHRLLFTFAINFNRHMSISLYKAEKLKVYAWIRRSLRVIHIFENYMNWPLTEIQEATTDIKHEKTAPIYFVVTGSSKWLKGPPILSLYLLLLRANRDKKHFEKFEKMKDLKYLSPNNHIMDGKHIIASLPIWKTLIDNYQYLCNFRSVKNSMKNSIGTRGISALKHNNCPNKIFQKRWQKVIKKK